MIRTVIEVAGHTSFKPFPKSAAGRRTVPLPPWLVTAIREHTERWPSASNEPIFSNEVGAPLRRTLFRSRIWRPSLVRAGMLGAVVAVGEAFEAQWSSADGRKYTERLRTQAQAVQHVSRNQAGGLRFHDLRHSYATWLVDDGVPPNMVQRVMGHERSSTTLDLYTRRTDNSDRILRALSDPDDKDPDNGSASAIAPDRRRGSWRSHGVPRRTASAATAFARHGATNVANPNLRSSGEPGLKAVEDRLETDFKVLAGCGDGVVIGPSLAVSA